MKKIFTVLLCFICISVATKSFANAKSDIERALTRRSLEHANNLVDPPFPCYIIAYSWTNTTITQYFVFATSMSDYTLVTSPVTFNEIGSVTFSGNNTLPFNSNAGFVNGVCQANLSPSTIWTMEITTISPTTYNGYEVQAYSEGQTD